MIYSMVWFWIACAFILGTIVGSFLNVCIARLPFEKSILWPGSRCGKCFQPIRWYDNLPLVSYLLLRGRCRTCGARFSPRYLLVELLTGLGFVGLFVVEMLLNVFERPASLHERWAITYGFYPLAWWCGLIFHAVLFCLLMVASFADLQTRHIPLSITATGLVIGLIGAVLMPWPWPVSPDEALLAVQRFETARGEPDMPWWQLPPRTKIGMGVYVWPVWGPLPDWLPAGSWRLGLATGIVGALAGGFLMRAVAFIFSKALGREALGMGDADLMMMAGAFVGWQPIVLSLFVAAAPGLLFAIFQVLVRRDTSLPFAPALSIGILTTLLGWKWIGPQVQQLFFFGPLLIAMAVFGGFLMLVLASLLRVARVARGRGSADAS